MLKLKNKNCQNINIFLFIYIFMLQSVESIFNIDLCTHITKYTVTLNFNFSDTILSQFITAGFVEQ